MSNLENDNEELEQYGRRLTLRIKGVPLIAKETSEEVLGKVNSLMSDSGCDIPDVSTDRTHGIDKSYVDNKSNISCKSIIVRVT